MRNLTQEFAEKCAEMIVRDGVHKDDANLALAPFWMALQTGGLTDVSVRHIREVSPTISKILSDFMALSGPAQLPGHIKLKPQGILDTDEIVKAIMAAKVPSPSVFANEKNCGYCGSPSHTRDTCTSLMMAYEEYNKRRHEGQVSELAKRYGNPELKVHVYITPSAVLKSPTAHSLLLLEPGTECPICLSKVVSIESLGAYGWRCSCASCYSPDDDPDRPSPPAASCAPRADSIEQAVETWLEEMREFAEELQDVRTTFVPVDPRPDRAMMFGRSSKASMPAIQNFRPSSKARIPDCAMSTLSPEHKGGLQDD